MKTRTAELHHAFTFTCEDCGRDSFVRAVAMPHAVIEADVVDEDREAFDALDGDLVAVPESVECGRCGARFGAECP